MEFDKTIFNYKLSLCNMLFIDFDGVIIDSNLIKENLISKSISLVDKNNIINNKAIEYFNKNAGIDRKVKLDKFYKKKTVEKILQYYSRFCNEILTKMEPNKCLIEFLDYFQNKFQNKPIYILSGGDKNEIVNFLKYNKIYIYFKDVLASEKSKFEHLRNLNANSNDIFIGDSNKDLEVANAFKLNFILMEDYKSLESFPTELSLKEGLFLRVSNFCSLIELCKKN